MKLVRFQQGAPQFKERSRNGIGADCYSVARRNPGSRFKSESFRQIVRIVGALGANWLRIPAHCANGESSILLQSAKIQLQLNKFHVTIHA